MNQKQFLPLGTVIELKGGKHKAMIIGFLPGTKTDYMDYFVCPYPEGEYEDELYCINRTNIEKIFHMGYKNHEWPKLENYLNNCTKEKNTEKEYEEVPIINDSINTSNLDVYKNQHLPIGTVVKLKGYKQPIMINRFEVQSETSHKQYEYAGYPYPVGLIKNNSCVMFNTKDINGVYYLGYESEENIKWQEYLDETERNKTKPKKR